MVLMPFQAFIDLLSELRRKLNVADDESVLMPFQAFIDLYTSHSFTIVDKTV